MGFANSGILNPGFSGNARVTKSEYKLFISCAEYHNSGTYSQLTPVLIKWENDRTVTDSHEGIMFYVPCIHFRQMGRMNIGQHATGGDGRTADQLVELVVVADSQLHMARCDPLAPVVAGDVTSQHDHLNGQVLHDGGEVNRRVITDAGGIVPLAQVPGDAADGELEAGARTAGRSHTTSALAGSDFFTFRRH